MSEICLLSDTSCDLAPELIKKYNITLIPYYVAFGDESYYKELEEITLSTFYQKLRSQDIFPKTSLPTIGDYYDKFYPLIEAGKSIICVCLSHHFSGSYNSAVNARELILENFPNAQIEVIDSLNATGGQGMIVLEIGRMIQDGLEFDKILEITKKLIPQTRIFFFVDTLDYLEKGGRIGKASALLGTILNVKPVIYLEDGQLFPVSKVRSKKRAVVKIIDELKKYVGDNEENYHFAIGHADSISTAHNILEIYNQNFKVPAMDLFFPIGVTIGTYTGPDTGGVCTIPKYENFL